MCCEDGARVEEVVPVVPSHDPVWVEHGNELEDERATKHVRTWVVCSQDEVKETVEHKGRGSLPGVHSAAEEKHLQTHTDACIPKVSIMDN